MCARDSSTRRRAAGRAADKDVYRHSTFKLVLLTVALTVAVTAIVIVIWEQLLRPPFFAWVEARYRALFEHANDGIAILRADDHRIVEVNERFAAIVGVEAAQLPGRRFEDLGCETPGGAPAVL